MNSGKVVLGLLAGIAAGAILGILFAPDKGAATRQKISKKGQDLSDDLTGKVKEFTDTISKQFDTIKEEVSHMANKGREQAKESAEQVSSAADKA